MSKVTIRADLKCKACSETRNYGTNEVVHGILKCKACGADIPVVINLDETDTDYKNVKGTVMRKKAKVHISKKDRRRQRNDHRNQESL